MKSSITVEMIIAMLTAAAKKMLNHNIDFNDFLQEQILDLCAQ